MLFSVNTNNNSLAAQKNLMRTNVGLNKSVQKLSSGSRINSSSDDAAGLSIAENLKNKAREAQSGRNSNNGISVIESYSGKAANTDLLLAPSIADRMSKLVSQPSLASIPLRDVGSAPRLEAEEIFPTNYEGDWTATSQQGRGLTTDLLNGAVDSFRAGLVQDPTAALQAQAGQSPDRAMFLLR